MSFKNYCEKSRSYSAEQLHFDRKIFNIRDLFIIRALKGTQKCNTLIQHGHCTGDKENDELSLSRKKLNINEVQLCYVGVKIYDEFLNNFKYFDLKCS